MVAVCGAGSGKADAAGLWIDYVLLPERLEEQLQGLRNAAGDQAAAHAELVNMFLDQAVASYKLSRKEPEGAAAAAATSSRGDSRTCSVLCERAVRVVVAARFDLADIEALIPRHQPLLLKALIKFDKPRSLIHECNFHRWILHRALAPDTTAPLLKSAAAAAPAQTSQQHQQQQQQLSTSGDSAEFFQEYGGAAGEEGAAVAFLENVLEREKVVSPDDVKIKAAQPQQLQQQQNGVIRDGTLKEDFICRVLFDVAEAHFMRGKIRRANELFTRCGHLAGDPDAVPRDRLNGFILACRAVIGSGGALPDENQQQEAVFACERSRQSMKRKSDEYCNGVAAAAVKKTTVVKTAAAAVVKENGLGNGYEVKTIKGEGEEEKQEHREDLVQVLADDVLPRRLSWPYCLSLESDGSLPALVRVKVGVCNVVRSVLQGGAFDSFLRLSWQVEDNREAAAFLMQLMARVVAGGGAAAVPRVQQFCTYVCCTVEQPWCWKLASKHGLVTPEPTVPGHCRGGAAGGTAEYRASGLVPVDILQAGSLTAVEQAAASGAGQPAESLSRAVQLRALEALEREKDVKLARQLYALAKRIHPGSLDNELLLWFLDKTSPVCSASSPAALPAALDGYEQPSSGAAEYVLVKLLEAGQWSLVEELCGWAEQRRLTEGSGAGLIFREAGVLGALVQAAGGGGAGAVLGKVEELVALLRDESGCLMVAGVKAAVPIISRLCSVRALEAVEVAVAGWMSPPLVELARYGPLAAELAAGSSKPRVSPECGRRLLAALLERLLGLPRGGEEEEAGRGCRSLLGLADLAFVDQAYLQALQLYLQAGALRSSFYCDRVTSMARELFTPWVITRMIEACKEIGAQLQAAILCQCLPDPDYESAFQILLTNPLIVDHDAALYFECVWEVPLLELLVNLHAKAGDRGRVNILIGILQQPALNVHNPAWIRKAHIAAMEQRFLQRFYAELM